jgi:hypothetical protein
MQHPATTAADSLDATPGTVMDDGQGNQSEIASESETDEDLDYAEGRWAAVEEELDRELPFAAGSSESDNEEEDQFYFITTR